DTFIWNPGDASDTVDGQGGVDTMQFNGANINEEIDLSANGSRLRLFRNIGTVTMDTNGVEVVNITARGAADQITVNDLSRTDVAPVNIDLAGAPDSGVGDGQPDTIIVNATTGDDAISIVGDASATDVLGLATQIHIVGAEAANDRLIVDALAGDDAVTASEL